MRSSTVEQQKPVTFPHIMGMQAPTPPPQPGDRAVLISHPHIVREKSPQYADAMQQLNDYRTQRDISETSPAVHAAALAQRVSKIVESVVDRALSRYVVVPAAMAVALGFNPVLLREIREGHGPMLDALKAANDALQATSAGSRLLDVIQSVSIFPLAIESNPLIDIERPPLVNGALLAGGIADIIGFGYPAVKVLEHIYSRTTRRDRELRGLEPLAPGVNPGVVIVAPTQLAEVMLENVAPPSAVSKLFGSPGRKVRTLVHPEATVSERYLDGTISHHIQVANPTAELLRIANLGRADRIILAGFEHTKSVFYGDRESGFLSHETCAELIMQIAAKIERTKQLKISLVVPKNSALLGQQAFADTFSEASPVGKGLKQRNIVVEVIHPEDVIIEELTRRFDQLIAKKRRDDPSAKLKVCLVGYEDTQALEDFAEAIRGINPDIECQILSESIIGDQRNGVVTSMSKDERQVNRGEVLAWSDVNVVYGGTNGETLALTTLIHFDVGASTELKQTISIVEGDGDKSFDFPAEWGVQSLCVYGALAARVKLS